MRVAVTGAGGFVGRRLCPALRERGHEVVALSRAPERLDFTGDIERRRFDPAAAPVPTVFEDIDAVIHLAGESVGGRWTQERKRAIYDSRVGGTRNLVASLQQCAVKPRALISASASGYYGSRGDEVLHEDSAAGKDFLASVCVDWEREAMHAREFGVRVACLRTGIVLGDGGALSQMIPPFRFGAGGPFGTGRQFVPWIHIDDLVAMYVFALEDGGFFGAINAVAPDYATGARFAQALGLALQRPAFLPAPPFALRLLLGEFADTLLASQLIVPAAAEDAGFVWRFALLETAMLSAVKGTADRAPGVRRFACEQLVDADLADVFAFFSQAQNLEAITPPVLRFAITSSPLQMRRGAKIDYRLQLHGLNLNWSTMIARWQPPHAFVDVQLHGPYALWSHMHTFEQAGGRVKIADEVLYALPFAPVSRIAADFVDREVRAIFEFRRNAIAQRFSRGSYQQ